MVRQRVSPPALDQLTTNELMRKSLKAEHQAWDDIKKRCLNPNCKDFKNYGARGILCMFSSFEEFIADVGPRPDNRYSISRIDNGGHYEPGNLCWDTKVPQNRNRRNCHLLTYKGETLCIAEWAERVAMPASRLEWRIRNGWSPKNALEIPPRRGRWNPYIKPSSRSQGCSSDR